jgi:hypothetical protein
MSVVREGRSDHPIKYKNTSGDTMPAFGIFRLATGARETSGELIPTAELIEFDHSMPLFVNSAKPTSDNAYGNCRSVNDSPFWVRYDTGNAPADGDIVGPVDGETFVSEKGDGFIVLFKDSAKELAWCGLLNSPRMWDAELTGNLSPASNSKTGASTASAKLLVPDPDNAGDLMDGPTITVTNRSLDASGLNGDYIVVARIGSEWRPVWIDC